MIRIKGPILLLFIFFYSFGNASVVLPVHSDAADPERVEALNNYVDFINESTHGLLIVVKLLENFNLDINQYVDLASYQINQYNNNDLPKDIFEDKEHWFYDASPYELYDKLTVTSPRLESHSTLHAKATEMVALLKKINQLRFQLESIIQEKDLSQKENLNLVYARLEEGASFYKAFFEMQKSMEKEIYLEAKKVESAGEYASLIDNLSELYESSRNLLLMIREKETENIEHFYARNARAVKNIQAVSVSDDRKMQTNKYKFNWNNLLSSAKNINESFNNYKDGVAVTEQYLIYGKFYYYYNVSCISKFNRYGTGIVSAMNNALRQLGVQKVRYTELPHYFKVIYPKKLEKVEYIESTNKRIRSIPQEIKARKVEKVNKQIRVTSEIVEFLFYDHMIQDGDIVSVNFNGEWIMEKEELELAPKKFMLKLNRNGKNYLLLHADNVGLRPPNTIGISYMMGGTKKEIILSSDLQTSELIELVIVD